MRKALAVSVQIALALLLLTPAVATRAHSQQKDDVLGNRERAARKDGRGSRTPELRASSADDLKPIANDRLLNEIEKFEQECFQEINRQRAARGLKLLEFSKELLPIARSHSQRMAEDRFFSHTDMEGRTVRQRVSEAGIRWSTLGENLAYSNGYINPVAASMRGWMDSPGHRDNILDSNFNRTAVGVWISDNGTVYFTEIFLKE